MSKEVIHPSTIDGIKRYAKQIKAAQGLKHAAALDAAARAGGFQNYAHAHRQLGANAEPAVGSQIYISVSWQVRETKEHGEETLPLRLSMPLDQLVKPAHLKEARHLIGFRLSATDHLTRDKLAASRSDARRQACAAARTLTFMEATGLRPSGSASRVYPRGNFANAVPGRDHTSAWYDPTAKAYVFVDEPYARAVERITEERLAWARHHGWDIVKSKWGGMYFPDGGCELYLAADKATGYSLAPILAALDALPPPIVEENWNGESSPAMAGFVSPAALSKQQTPPIPLQSRQKPAPRVTVSFQTVLGGERRRPDARMPIDAHAEVGKLLKSVLRQTRLRRGAYNRIDVIRSELDEWVQREYDRSELPDEIFFTLYYKEDSYFKDLGYECQTPRQELIQSIEAAKSILTQHYPDCAPLRAILKSADLAIKSLESWSV